MPHDLVLVGADIDKAEPGTRSRRAQHGRGQDVDGGAVDGRLLHVGVVGHVFEIRAEDHAIGPAFERLAERFVPEPRRGKEHVEDDDAGSGLGEAVDEQGVKLAVPRERLAHELEAAGVLDVVGEDVVEALGGVVEGEKDELRMLRGAAGRAVGGEPVGGGEFGAAKALLGEMEQRDAEGPRQADHREGAAVLFQPG